MWLDIPAPVCLNDKCDLRCGSMAGAGTNNGFGQTSFWLGCLALLAVCMQAPTLMVRHTHAGGAIPHRHGSPDLAGVDRPPGGADSDSAEDADPWVVHGHRLFWGLELHEPVDCQIPDHQVNDPSTAMGDIDGTLPSAPGVARVVPCAEAQPPERLAGILKLAGCRPIHRVEGPRPAQPLQGRCQILRL
ncbi:MAG: hypothetical protein DWH82_12735 [Planctomycetota bacterium]|nr:MAG: hypothetical protein DWH82_12735 [Planctomycetota bacterium]